MTFLDKDFALPNLDVGKGSVLWGGKEVADVEVTKNLNLSLLDAGVDFSTNSLKPHRTKF